VALRAIEQLNYSKSYTETSTNAKSAERVFFCPTASPIAALAADDAPKTNTVHPDYPTLICRNIRTNPNGQGSTMITAFYDNLADSHFHVLSNATALDWGWAFRPVKIKLPLNVVGFINADADNPNPAPTKAVWTLGEYEINEDRLLRPLRIIYTISGNNTRVFDPIRKQNNSLHLIQGTYYRFTAPPNCVRRLNETTFELNYEWELDEGTPLPAIGPAGDHPGFVLLRPSDANNGFLRNPYTKLEPSAPEDPSIGAYPLGFDFVDGMFASVAISEYQIDQQGWQTLPGVPNLG